MTGRAATWAALLAGSVFLLPIALLVLAGAVLQHDTITGGTGADGTPLLLGPSRLDAAQLTAWYAGTGHHDTSTADPATLMTLYTGDGQALGVRADLAVAQAAVETGYLEHFPAGAGGANNYAGIAVYDGQNHGAGFPTAQEGVHAHLALLREYADAGYHDAPVHAGRPGCCPTVASLAGTWATDPGYGEQILAVYRQMLASAGLPPDEPATASGDVSLVLAYAQAQLGKPYRWGAAGPDAYDCSGLTAAAYRTIGVQLPHNSAAQYAAAQRPINDAAQLDPGDLLFWSYGTADTIHHVALYLGGGQMIEAYATGYPVRIAPARIGRDGYWGATRPLTDPGYRPTNRKA